MQMSVFYLDFTFGRNSDAYEKWQIFCPFFVALGKIHLMNPTVIDEMVTSSCLQESWKRSICGKDTAVELIRRSILYLVTT